MTWWKIYGVFVSLEIFIQMFLSMFSFFYLCVDIHLLRGVLVEHGFDFGDRPGWVQVLWASFRAVHDGVAFEDAEFIVHLLQSLGLRFVSAINDPSIGLLDNSWSEVFIPVPPVTWASGGAASAKNTLVKSVQLCSIFNWLEVWYSFSVGASWNFFLFQPWLDRFVLCVEVGHVWHEIFDYVHVWERVDLWNLAAIFVDPGQTRQIVFTVNIHRATTANTFSAGSSETESWILFVLDLDQSVQNHFTGHLVQIQFVFLHNWGLSVIRVPSVDLECLHSTGSTGGAWRSSSNF